MGAISLDEYKKKKKAVQQDVARPNTILFSDYNTKYGNQKLPTEVTRTGNSFLLPTVEQPQIQETEKTYKKIYNKELEKQKKIKNQIDSDFYDKGVQTTTGTFSTQRNILPTQQQTEITKNKKFEVYDKPLEKNQEVEEKFQDIKSSNEYKEKQKNLIEQSNKVGYAKYDYDKSVVDNDDIGWFDKTLGTVIGGAKSIFDISGGLINENGNTYYLPNKSELKQEKTQNSYDTKIGKLLGSAGYEIGKIGASTLMNQVLPGTGTGLYWSKMFIDGTNSAMQEGYDSGSALAYGAVNTGFEYLTGKLLGSATKGLTGGKSSGYEELLNSTFSKVIKNPKIANVLANAGSEATEEFIQEYLDNLSKLAILEKSTNAKDYVSVFANKEVLSDALYSALVGSITGGTLGTITGNDTNVDNTKNDVYDILASELENTKKGINNKETIKAIDNVLENINDVKKGNISIDNNETSNIESLITEYEELQKQENISKKQEQRMVELQKQISELQNHLTNSENITTKNILPTVNDIVARENKAKMSVNEINNEKKSILPSINDSKNQILPSKINSNAKIFPAVNNLAESNVNAPLTIKSPKISPETAQKIGNIINNKDSNIKYTSSYISSILKEAGIKVPTSFQYVKNISSDLLNYETTKKLTDTQDKQIKNALFNLRSIDTTSVNNINSVLAPTNNIVGNQIIPVNQDIQYSQNTNMSFAEQLDLWAQGKWNNRSQLVLFKHTPQLYLELGLKDNPITISASKLDRIVNKSGNQKGNYHNLGLETTKKLPEAIANPLNILESSTVDDSIVVVTELSDNEDRIVIASIAIDGTGRIEVTDINNKNEIKNIPSNVMTSAYGRNNYDEWMKQNKDRIIYDKDDGIIKKRVNGDWLQLPIRNNSTKVNGERLQLPKGVNYIRANGQWVQFPNVTNSEATASAGNTVKNSITPTLEVSAFSDNNIPQVDNNVKSDILPINNNMQNKGTNTKKILNPNEISHLTLEDANTTPILPTRKVETGKGESKFASNIEKKTNMLSDASKSSILSEKDVQYYKQVTNEESLEKAFDRINEGRRSEVERWFNKKENFNSTDVAEGWILLKQYQDSIQKETDIIMRDELNRTMVEVAKKMREMGTKAGQTVQAFNILNRLTPEGMVYYAQSELSETYDIMSKNKTKEWIDENREKFELTPDETQFIMDNMKEIQDMDDGYEKRVKLAEIQKIMTDKLPPEKGAKIKSWMRISMLFNPKTQVRNIVGNAAIAPVNYFGDLFSSYADKIIAKKTGVRTTGNMNVKAILKGMKQGAYEATNDYRKGINTKDMEGNRFEISEGKSFNDKNAIGRALNRTESLLNYVMDIGDRVFSQASFENSLQNQMVLNNTTEITQDMIDIARAESLQRTWNDNNKYTRFVLNARAGINKFLGVNGYGIGDVAIPFAKTPANLTKAIVDYSPVGLVNTLIEGNNLKKALSNGQYTPQMQHKFVQDLGKATAGTMLYVLGVALALAKITSGKSDDDKDVANFLKNALGISSYSIKIGNKSFTYDWAQPIAAPLSITANIINSKNNKGQALSEAIVGSLDSAGSILLEQSFLQSINEILNDNDGIVSGLINEILDLPARAIPTFSKQIADMVDGTQRTSFEYDKPLETAVNKIKAKIPFVSKTLAPTVDTMGREAQKYGGKNNIFNVFLNPANVSTENISSSAKEIYRLYKSTGETDIMPRVAPYYVNSKGEKVTMTSEQRAQYQKVSGDIIEKSVKELLSDKKYKNMNDAEKADVINEIVNYSYNKAKKDVLGIEMSDKYNKVNSYTTDGGKVADYYLNKKEIDYSYNFPEKYKTIKQITTYDKYLTYQDEIDGIKDKYENTNQRKNAIIKYVNSLELSAIQKAMLIKMNYSSFNQYNKQIIEYINNQKLSIDEKSNILTKLGFKIKNGKVY